MGEENGGEHDVWVEFLTEPVTGSHDSTKCVIVCKIERVTPVIINSNQGCRGLMGGRRDRAGTSGELSGSADGLGAVRGYMVHIRI